MTREDVEARQKRADEVVYSLRLLNQETLARDVEWIRQGLDLALRAVEYREALAALHAEVEMAESVGICLPDRVPSLRAGQLLAASPSERPDD